jgi:hypothetical protein
VKSPDERAELLAVIDRIQLPRSFLSSGLTSKCSKMVR